jgi:hypothetical protein
MLKRFNGDETALYEHMAALGSKGGKNGSTGGYGAYMKCDGSCGLDDKFGLDHYKSQCSGYKGGLVSRRKKKLV